MQTSTELLEALSHEGVLIHTTVRYWRASKKLSPEDLGLDPDAVDDRLICLGQKRLLPKESLKEFALIESRLHGIIDAYTFPFLGGLAHYLPNACLEGLMTRLRKLETQFEEQKANFLAEYEPLRNQSLRHWEEAAQTLTQQPERLLQTIEAAFPTREALQKRFAFDVHLFQISLPQNLQMDLVSLRDQEKVKEARAEAVSQASAKIQEDLGVFVSDCIASMREQTATICEEMLSSMREGSKGVHQKTLNRLIRFIDEFKQLNFAGDRAMEEELERVRQEFLVRSAEDYRGDALARERLQAGLQGLADQARALSKQDHTDMVQRFGAMGHRRIIKVA